jgi:hypothetical protein
MLAACGSPPVEGVVTDGITGSPLTDFRLLARASGEVRATCGVFETGTGPEGRFIFSGLCTGSSAYEVTAADDAWWFPDGATIAQGGGSAINLAAWHAPSGTGLYSLSNGVMGYLKTAGDLKKDTVYETEKTFYYPSEIPSKVPRIEASDYLVLVGAAVSGTMFYLVHPYSEGIEVNSSSGSSATLRNVSTIGAKFSGPTEYEDSEPLSPDASKLIAKKSGDRAATYVRGDALPPGRYAVFKERARRVYLVDFGAASEAPTADADAE